MKEIQCLLQFGHRNVLMEIIVGNYEQQKQLGMINGENERLIRIFKRYDKVPLEMAWDHH